MVKEIVVGLLGGGRMGQIHLQTLLSTPGVSVEYVLARSQQTLDKLKRTFLSLQTTKFLTSDHEDVVMEDIRVTCVVVASPSGEHERQIRKALERGKAVFCEKPIARDIPATQALFDLSSANGLHLFCAFQRRFDHNFRALKKSVEEGELGRIYMIKSCSRDPDTGFVPSKAYFSIFFDSTVHDIDMCCWTLGEHPNRVYAVGAAQDGREGDWDTVALTLNFPSGAIATIDQSRHSAYGYDQRLEVLGAKGMGEVGNVRGNTCTLSTSTGTTLANPSGYFDQRYLPAYREEMLNFLRLLEGKPATFVSAEDVIMGLKIAEAAERSIVLGVPQCL